LLRVVPLGAFLPFRSELPLGLAAEFSFFFSIRVRIRGVSGSGFAAAGVGCAFQPPVPSPNLYSLLRCLRAVRKKLLF